MTIPIRPLCVVAASVFAFTSCSTVNKTLDRSMNFFKGKPAAAEEVVVAPDGTVSTVPKPVSRANFNTALMVVEVNGVKRKVVIELDPLVAPKTVENFKKLVNEGYYDGMAFHRAIRNYIVQTGDPASKSDDKRDEWGLTDSGYKLPAELKGVHTKGALAMARPGAPDAADKSSSGSQFYVCLRTQKRLDGNYSVFGRVTHGLDVLEAVGSVAVDTNDTPVRRVDVKSIRLVPSDSPDLKEEPLARKKTKPDSEKGVFERFIERIW